MQILEIVTFGLTIFVPLFFISLLIVSWGKLKKKKSVRNKLIRYAIISLLINGLLFAGVKMINVNFVEKSNNYESDNKSDSANDSHKESSESNAGEEPESSTDTKPNSKNDSKPANNDTKPTTNNNPSSTTSGNTTSKGFSIEVRDGVTYIDGYLIVNKTYALPETYVPTNTYKKITDPKGACAECLINDAYNAYANLRKDAVSNGLTLWIASGFRAYSYQNGLYNNYVKRSGKEKADTYSARPGHSEHQSGYAFDLNTVDDSFANTKEGKWVNENCYKYGFIIRYPKGKDNETGYKYEPWHLRYVGVDLATKLYNGGDWITMEDYFGITSQYAN